MAKQKQNILYDSQPSANKELNQLIESSDRILYECTTVFPFDLFPDKVIVDENKIDIVYKYFFWTERVFSIMIHDIRTIRVSTGPLFASLLIEIKGYEINPEQVSYLPKQAAYSIKQIVMGLMAVKNEGIDTTQMSLPDLRRRLEEIGVAEK